MLWCCCEHSQTTEVIYSAAGNFRWDDGFAPDPEAIVYPSNYYFADVVRNGIAFETSPNPTGRDRWGVGFNFTGVGAANITACQISIHGERMPNATLGQTLEIYAVPDPTPGDPNYNETVANFYGPVSWVTGIWPAAAAPQVSPDITSIVNDAISDPNNDRDSITIHVVPTAPQAATSFAEEGSIARTQFVSGVAPYLLLITR